ncbi:MAG: hypothetical protein QOE23_627 [Pseudonocardiales bacterium]|jgi:hypothetical protein|nr:hypothetical protein [Pseudonocardiales bacterium]
MYALGPLLFVLLLAGLATAGFTGVGVQDSRDTRYTLVCTRTAPPAERRPRISQRLRSERPGRWDRLAAFAGRHVTH